MDILRADVLVVGGGGAAGRAAVEAHNAGAKVVLATKGRLGVAGATAAALAEIAGLAVADKALDPTDSPELHMGDILEGGLGMCDKKLVRILTEEAIQTIPDLEKWGVRFERDSSGNYLITKACFASRTRNYKLMGHGRKITDALTKQILMRDIRVMEDAMLVDLLTEGGSVRGAVLLTSGGDLIMIPCAKVVLGTGGAGELFEFSMSPSDITGDGCAAGYRAGAQLFNMEFIQFGFGTLPRKSVLDYWLWSFHPLLTNGRGEEFLDKYLPAGVTAEAVMDMHANHYPFSNRLISRYLEISVDKEAREGLASENGGVYADFTGRLHERDDLPDTPRKLWRKTKEWYERIGMPIGEKPMEIALYVHAMNGGLRVDENAETRVGGLFAVGECASGPHGADRLGGGMLTACQVFGKRAGIAAASEKARVDISPRMAEQCMEIENLVAGFKAEKKGSAVSATDLRKRIQALSSKYLMLDRGESGLRAYREQLDAVEDELNNKVTARSRPELIAALEMRNLIAVGRIMAEAAEMRKETRGGHVRGDYPQMDAEARWLMVNKSATGLPESVWVTPSE